MIYQVIIEIECKSINFRPQKVLSTETGTVYATWIREGNYIHKCLKHCTGR